MLEDGWGVDTSVLIVVEPLGQDGGKVLELRLCNRLVSKGHDAEDLGELVVCNWRLQLWEHDRLAGRFEGCGGLGCSCRFLGGC